MQTILDSPVSACDRGKSICVTEKTGNEVAKTDTLIVIELSRLGRSTAEVIALVNALVERSIRLIAIKQSLDIDRQDTNSKIAITLFSLFAELERALISLRTKEALAARKAQS